MPLTVPNDIDKYFYNRQSDIKRISLQLSSIFEDLPCQLLLTGQRGVGKTFLLKKILNDQDDDVLTMYLDISRIFSKYGGQISEEAVLKEMLVRYMEIIEEVSDNGIKAKFNKLISNLKLNDYDFSNSTKIFEIPIPAIKDNYQKLSEFVMELPQNIVDSSENIKGIIIVIDEFQQLKYVNNPNAFFWLFRSFIQDQRNVAYVFTGSVSKTAEVIEMINGQTGAFGGRMIQIDIGPFSKEETLNYIGEKAHGIQFSEDGFERFYKCTRGIPAYINSFCNVLDSGIVYDDDLVKESFYLKMDQIVIMWLYVWGNLNDSEKEIIKLLVGHNGLRLNEIVDNLDISKVTVIKYIDSLSNKAIINYFDRKYFIDDAMLKTWLKHKKETEGYYPY